jgi:DNA (cytosine-5)-methyltransferase 1
MDIVKDYIDIEIFPCAGGMGEGFRRSGVEFDLMIEIEENHCDSYEANLGHRPTQMDARSFLEMLMMGWRPPKRVRMIVADPPCTPWSRAGKRLGQDDPRDMLDGTCRIIAILQPDVYLIGNVPGLDDGPNLPIVQKTIGDLSKHGYCTADFARLDAANYGVPQHRIRPFWFGHKKGPCIQWPAPTHGDPEELTSMTLPGITALIPWVSCKQALGHLSADDLGRPIKLRHRKQNGVQEGSAPEKPARVVGTSNLSDGNVLIGPDQPRSGSKKKRDRSGDIAQGDRVNTLDAPSATVTRNGGRARMGAASTLSLVLPEAPKKGTRKRDEGRVPQGYRTRDPDRPSATITSKVPRAGAGESSAITVRPGDHAMSRPDKPARTLTRNTHSDGAVIVNAEPHHPPSYIDEPAMAIRAGSGGGANRALQLSGREMFPPSSPDEPAKTVRAMGRTAYMTLDAVDEDGDLIAEHDFTKPLPADFDISDAYEITEGEQDYILENKRHPNATPDAPAPTMGAKSRGQGAQVLVVSDKHRANAPDAPSHTVRGGGDGHSAPQVVVVTGNHPPSPTDGPANTVRATTGGGSNRALEWPWQRPSTTLQCDERIAPPGHHGQSFMSDADAVVISEKAAAILQGFPETWVFCGNSKKARWSQIGQAMPPPLAHAVANSVVEQIRKAED